MKTLEQLRVCKGEWKVGSPHPYCEEHIVFSDGYAPNRSRIIAECNKNFAESSADARLIAAAPELYEALRESIVALKNRLPGQPTLTELEIIIRAEAAIRKATGESEKGETK